MSGMNPRHKYGTFALILAVLAFLLSIFSTGATWATVDDKSTTIEDESFFDNLTIEVALQGDLQLTDMDSEVEVTIFFEGSDEPIEEQSFRESESYEELAEKSTGDMRDTFEEMDTAGTVAQWMIWLGIIAMLLTAVFAFCSLAQITNSRFTTYSGSVATFLLFFAPIIWYILLPSGGTYTSLEAVEDFFFFEEWVSTNFDPSPSTGLFLSLLSGLTSVAMMVMVYRHNISEVVNEKPKWMNSLFNLKFNDEEKVAQPINFTEKKEQAGLLLQKSVNAYKSSRTMQALTVLIVLILISIPLYSMLFEEEEEANAYQRDLVYSVDVDYNRIAWIEDTTVVLNDGETLSLSFTEEDFPDEAKDSNTVLIEFYILILDNGAGGDNEQTSGLGCAANSGEDAPDSIGYQFNTPGGSESSQTNQANKFTTAIELFEYPEEFYGPFTGYTVAEIEDLFDSSDDVEGDYEFKYTANAEAGDPTIECDRSDSSVEIEYAVILAYQDVTVYESTQLDE